mgnify:CR=1 FL=1
MKLLEFLQPSAGTPGFAAAIRDFIRSGLPNDRVRYSPGLPTVKVERTLTKLFELHPSLSVDAVAVSGRSGCEFFRGELLVRTGEEQVRIHFDWDCRWRAEEMGWTDYFGFPDQIRAAREYGYDCFRRWEVEPSATDAAA